MMRVTSISVRTSRQTSSEMTTSMNSLIAPAAARCSEPGSRNRVKLLAPRPCTSAAGRADMDLVRWHQR